MYFYLAINDVCTDLYLYASVKATNEAEVLKSHKVQYFTIGGESIQTLMF